MLVSMRIKERCFPYALGIVGGVGSWGERSIPVFQMPWKGGKGGCKYLTGICQSLTRSET